MRNRKNVIIAIMICAAILMATGYAYFATRLNINATGNITSNWNIYFSNITPGTAVGNASNAKTPSITGTTATMEANLQLPGDSMTYELTLMNGGTIAAVIEDIEISATGSTAIIYEVTGLEIGDKLAGGASKVITIKIEYDKNFTSQPSETSKTVTIEIDAVQDVGQGSNTGNGDSGSVEVGTFATRILSDNTPQSDANIDFSQPSSDTNGQGLYYTNVNTEYNKTTYYFRGDVENNYVILGEDNGTCDFGEQIYSDSTLQNYITDKETCLSVTKICYTGGGSPFAVYDDVSVCSGEGMELIDDIPTWKSDAIWRIVRINEDGSVRIIKQAGIVVVGYDDSPEDNAYVGYMYGQTGATGDNAYKLTHSNVNNSDVKSALDTWYNENLSNYSGILADAGFCNDRSIHSGLGYGINETTYASYNRIVNLKKPQFACPNESNDLFTLTTSSKGNKALTNPIGLLTIDEVVYAGIAMESPTNSYLFNENTWWTISPASLEGGLARLWHVDGDSVSGFDAYYSENLRPVINLNSTVGFILEGTGDPGTITNPYVIKTN